MYLEQELYALIVLIFGMVLAFACVILIWCYAKSHNKHLVWFGGHILSLSLACYFFYKCITYLPNEGNSMYSEEQSFTLALAGLCWIISMLLEFIGVCKVVKSK